MVQWCWLVQWQAADDTGSVMWWWGRVVVGVVAGIPGGVVGGGQVLHHLLHRRLGALGGWWWGRRGHTLHQTVDLGDALDDMRLVSGHCDDPCLLGCVHREAWGVVLVVDKAWWDLGESCLKLWVVQGWKGGYGVRWSWWWMDWRLGRVGELGGREGSLNRVGVGGGVAGQRVSR